MCTPEDAFRCFMGTEIEVLAIGNCFLGKEEQDPRLEARLPDRVLPRLTPGVRPSLPPPRNVGIRPSRCGQASNIGVRHSRTVRSDWIVAQAIAAFDRAHST